MQFRVISSRLRVFSGKDANEPRNARRKEEPSTRMQPHSGEMSNRSPSLWEGLGEGLAVCDTQKKNPRGLKARADSNQSCLRPR
jgi:hypothetical protein